MKKVFVISLIFMLALNVLIYPFSSVQAVNQLSVSINTDGSTRVNPANNFPMYYTDSAGTRLQACLGTNPDGSGAADANCVVLPDANYDGINPISFPNNFPGEFFYYIADAAEIQVGPNLLDRARFRLALEGTFTGGNPVAGTQITFLRVNLQQMNNLTPLSAYTVNYPFGTFNFNTDAAGIAISNVGGGATYRVEDGPGVAGDFTLLLPATATNLNKFLASLNPTTPAGYLGDGATAGLIEAGTNGAIFSIDGPNIGGLGVNHVETALWTVAGKIATPILNSLTITPATPSVTASSTQQFTASALDQFGDAIVPANPITWSSSDPVVGTIDSASGLFSALTAGTTVITAQSGAISATTTVTVVAATPTLTSIIIAPANYAMTYGTNQQFSAIALDQFGNPLVAAPVVAWSSSNPAVGTIDSAGGLFSALAAGATVITATSGAVSATTTVNVSAPAPSPLAVSVNADGTTKVDPANGFPVWYSGTNGVRVGQCLAGANGLADPNCVVAGAAGNPLSGTIAFPANFPDEFFYYLADSDPLTVGPASAGTARFRMALEGAFASGAPVSGQQSTFLRINLQQINGLSPNSAYTVTYPFGSFIFHTDGTGQTLSEGNAGGGGTAFRNEDGSGTAGDFTLLLPATATNISKFLAAVTPAAPVGYLGNPGATQTIEAGTSGASFAIDGPNIGGLGVNHVETALWSLAGKILENNAPVITPIADQAATTSALLNFTVIAADAQADPITFSLAPITSLGNEASAVINPTTGVFSWTPNTAGASSFTITASDGSLSSSATVNINISAGPAVDLVAPVITMLGTSPVEVTQNTVYTDAGATALDDVDGNISANIVTVNNVNTAAIGTYTVTYNVSDAAGNTATQVVRTVNVVAATPAATTTVAVSSAATTIVTGATQQLSAAAVDTLGVAVTPPPAITFTAADPAVAAVDPATGVVTAIAPGSTIITAVAPNVPEATVQITVINPLPDPVLTTVNVVTAAGAVITGGTQQLSVAALDQNGAAIVTPPAPIILTSLNPAVATVDPATGVVTAVAPGSTIITADCGGVTATTTITVNAAPIIDTTAPVITLLGTNPVDVVQNTVYTDAGATALDDIDGNLTANIVTVSSVNTAAIGTYTVTYNVSDAAGNAATQVVRTVNVSAAPIVTPVPARIEISLDANAIEVNATTTAHARVYDENNLEIHPTPTIDWSSNNPSVATIGSHDIITGLAEGTAIISASLGQLTATSTINVHQAAPADNVAPVITLNGANPMSILQNSAFTDPGASAVDAVDGTVTVTASGTVNSAVIGSYTLTYTAADTAGNLASLTRTVNVNAAPVIPALTTIQLTPSSLNLLTGSSTRLIAVTLDQNNSPISASVNWQSSNETIARVSGNGTVTAIAAGTATITAQSGAISGSAAVTIASSAMLELMADDNFEQTLIAQGAFVPDIDNDYASTTELTVTRDISIKLRSGSGDCEVNLPTGVKISDIDGRRIDSSQLVATTTQTNFLAGLDADQTAKGAIRWGIDNMHLQFSQPITLRIFVGHDLNGQTLNIRRSIDGASGWTSDGIVAPATSVVTNGQVTFQATKASVYAAAATVTAAPVVTPPAQTSSGGAVILGGYGGVFTPPAPTTPSTPAAPSAEVQSQIERQLEIERQFKASQGQVLGEKIYPNGTLLRTPDKKIFVINGDKKQRVLTLNDLKKFVGKKIMDVSFEDFKMSRGSGQTVLGKKAFSNGTLLRTPDKKIFVIINGQKQRILNLEQLKKYSGKKINDVGFETLNIS